MLKETPRISIVTPSFNQADFLEAAINSILSQNYPNLEYIIIDGGSIDGSVDIIKRYEKYLHFWCSEPDAGHYDALNKGFAHATGDIMAWLNSDDMYCPWALKTVASIMSELPEVEWITTLQATFWDWHGFCIGINPISGYSKEAFLDGCYTPFYRNTVASWIQQESTFWHRNLWQKVGNCLRTEYQLAADFDLWARFFNHADLYGVDCPIGGFRTQFNQRSRQAEKYACEAKKSLDELRELNHWSPSSLRHLALNLLVDRIPKVKTLLKSTYVYTGKRVARKEVAHPHGQWQIQEYQFFKQLRLS